MPQLPGLLAGHSRSGAALAGGPEERLAGLLARPGAVHNLHRPIITLADGRCVGYDAQLLVEDHDRDHHNTDRHDTDHYETDRYETENGEPWDDESPDDGGLRAGAGGPGPGPWFRAAARTGLSGRLGATVLEAALRERATLPGERFLVVTLDPHALGHPDVAAVFEQEDDVADLTLTLVSPDVPARHRAFGVLDDLRARGLQLAVPAGPAGVADLRVVERLAPDVIVMGAELIRDVQRHRVRQRLVDVVVELAEDTGATTLAEEVESLDETQNLRALGVRFADGWLFGRARPGFAPPPAQVCEWLRLQQIDLR